MGRVLSNNTGMRVATEASIGTLPGTPIWRIVEFDTIGAYGATITTVVRRPVSNVRGRKKGAVTDLESAVDFSTDLTMDAFLMFAEGFVFATFQNAEFDLYDGTGTLAPPAVAASDTFTVDALGATLFGKLTYTLNQGRSLLMANGYTGANNNGLHELAAAPAADTDTSLTVATSLTDETPANNARLEVCGVRVSDGDLTLSAPSGGTATLTSGGDVSNWATLGVVVGMWIHIGSANASGVVQNALSDSAEDDTYGYARVTAISNGVLTLDKLDDNLDSGANNTSDGDADIMFGRFARNVATDDSAYLERTYQFELAYPGLDPNGTDTDYEYAIGNFGNELTLNLPLTNKATVDFGFIGTNSEDIVAQASRKSVTNTFSPLRTTAINTSSNIVSITTDVVSSSSDVCFKSLTFTVQNNVSPEKCLGTLGATFVNAGLFAADLEGQMLFTSRLIINAIKNNTTVTFAAVIRNDNGAIAMDIPEMTLSGGGREYPLDQSVLVNITGASFTSNTFGFDIGFSHFANVPGVVAA